MNAFLTLLKSKPTHKQGSTSPNKASPLGVINVRNFGPIEKGEIGIMPLTVLTGPNNSGKSYAALLIQSTFSSPATPMQRAMHLTSEIIYAVQKSISKLFTQQQDHVFLSPTTTSQIIQSLVSGYEKRITDSIERSFSAKLKSLVTIGSKRGTLKIRTDYIQTDIGFSNNRLTYKRALLKNIHKIKLIPDPNWNHNTCSVQGTVLSIKISRTSGITAVLRIVESIAQFMMGYRAFYLPAARSGILQGHKAISASIIRHAPYAGLEDVEIPKLSGVISDFIGDFIDIPSRPGPFYDLAVELEKEILKGQINVEHRKFRVPEIKYTYKQHDIPMHLSSSTVSEMAPFVLYLKHLVPKNSILIIEEPESHLHPGNQSILARFLVRLIRKGLTVVITTHSPFMLEQLNNHIQAGGMSPEKRKGIRGFKENDFVTRDEVAAYLFEPSSDTRPGHIIRPMRISDENRIPTEKFVEVSNNLYKAWLNIQDLAGAD